MGKDEDQKLYIPHTYEPGCTLVGLLHRVEDVPTQGRKVVLILHGGMGHKDYLFQKRLAYAMPLDSFRFDFRGNHESNGEWRVGGLKNDVEDINVVVACLTKTYGYVVDIVVGHSRGSIAGMSWAAISEEGKSISGLVNIAGRYRLEGGREQLNPLFVPAFAKYGYYTWNTVSAGKSVSKRVYPEDVHEFSNFDLTPIWTTFPPACDVLTLHGLNDRTVPSLDATIYARAFSNQGPRRTGTHLLHYIENCDHNFVGHHEEVIKTIVNWLDQKQKGVLRDGIWGSGVKGRL